LHVPPQVKCLFLNGDKNVALCLINTSNILQNKIQNIEQEVIFGFTHTHNIKQSNQQTCVCRFCPLLYSCVLSISFPPVISKKKIKPFFRCKHVLYNNKNVSSVPNLSQSNVFLPSNKSYQEKKFSFLDKNARKRFDTKLSMSSVSLTVK
jgi:hypothetical protein